jgi:hypothetical protein
VKSCYDGWRKEELTIASWNALSMQNHFFCRAVGRKVAGVQTPVEAGTTGFPIGQLLVYTPTSRAFPEGNTKIHMFQNFMLYK